MPFLSLDNQKVPVSAGTPSMRRDMMNYYPDSPALKWGGEELDLALPCFPSPLEGEVALTARLRAVIDGGGYFFSASPILKNSLRPTARTFCSTVALPRFRVSAISGALSPAAQSFL